MPETADIRDDVLRRDKLPEELTLADEIRAEIAQALDRTRDIDDDELMELVTEAVFRNPGIMACGAKREIADMVYNLCEDGYIRCWMTGPSLKSWSWTDKIFIERRPDKQDGGCIRRPLEALYTILSRGPTAVNEASPIVDFVFLTGPG